METVRIRDPGWKKAGSGIRDKHPGSATLVSRDFCFRFFHESSSPQPLKITLGLFRIFRKFAKIFASLGATPVSTTPVVNLELGISPQIFEKKIETALVEHYGAREKLNHEKNLCPKL
jgi:hypothetical protein